MFFTEHTQKQAHTFYRKRQFHQHISYSNVSRLELLWKIVTDELTSTRKHREKDSGKVESLGTETLTEKWNNEPRAFRATHN